MKLLQPVKENTDSYNSKMSNYEFNPNLKVLDIRSGLHSLSENENENLISPVENLVDGLL